MHPITILSDLHVGHPFSILRRPEQIAPLLPRDATVVFNGDSVEMRSRLDRDTGQARREQLRELCEARGSRAIFLTGNHDPLVSDLHHIDLCDGKVLVTHGDILFHECSPWSHEGPHIGEEHTRLLGTLAEHERKDLTIRLRIAKEATRITEKIYTAEQSFLSVLRNLVMELIPPWRPLRILGFWRQAPGLAAAIAREFRPEARFMIVGHLHHAGVWEVDGRTIINTGSFFPFPGRRMVEIRDGRIEVRKIRGYLGDFHPGRVVYSAPLER